MLTEKIVKRAIGNLSRKIHLKVYGDQKMLEFVKRLSEIIPVDYEFETEFEKEMNLPAIELKGYNLFFHAIPQYSELESFLLAIKMALEFDKKLEEKRAKVITFVSPICPNCKFLLDSMNRIALKLGLEHHVVDVTIFPETAEKAGVQGVPTVFVDKMVFRGALNERGLERLIKLGLEGDYYEYMVHKLERGEIDDLKILVDKTETIVELIAHENFFVRLGAMALIENLQKNGKKISRKAKEKIIRLLEHEDRRIKEDAIMMLGIVGEKEDLNLLENYLMDVNLSESAKEAIEMIREKYGY
ncbi:MAG: thioredoxin family protein [Archaeoglobaceae archaeon]